MSSPTFLSRSLDYIGGLGARLRDLQGYRTLAYELIQNADDAHSNWMRFDVRRDALVLDNGGVFTDCGDVDAPACRWIGDGVHNHRCDFHRFRLIGAGDKRLQEGTTGAFGIGFIAVYQLTDQPELISAGRHWILHEERSESERIEVCSGCPSCSQPGLPGTRFILPFAYEAESPLRQALKADAVPGDVTERLMEELERSLPVAMLFLKNLSAIEVRDGDGPRRSFARERDGDTVIISQGASAEDRVWHLLRGDFQSEAAALRREHPGRIEDKRSAEVVIALPAQELSAGLLCASLPTEESPGLPFHVNADFFPSNDRKHVILVEDYQSQWNRAALLAAARTVAEATPRLTTMLGAERFWQLAAALSSLAFGSRRDKRDRAWGEFWDALEIALREQEVVLTSSHEWTTASGGVALLVGREEAPHIPVLEGLGIRLVAEALRPYQGILRSIGVPVLDVETLCSALAAAGLDKPVAFDDLPSCLTSTSGREALWSEIDILLARLVSTPNAKRAGEERLQTVSFAPTLDRFLRPCRDVSRGDATTVRLLTSLGLDIPLLDEAAGAFESLNYLCRTLRAEDVIDALEEGDIASIQQRWREGRFSVSRLIAWFESRREQVLDDEELRKRLAALPVYPSSDLLRPLTDLVLPGGFEDPIGLTSLVDMGALVGRREFLVALGVAELEFRTYVLEHLSQALDDDDMAPTVRQEAVALLADHLGELMGDSEVQQVLARTRLVKCTDGEYRCADDCYFPDGAVQEVLGDDARVVVLPEERVAAVRGLLEWLGVSSVPRLRDVVQVVHRIADGPYSPASVLRIRRIVAHLGSRLEAPGAPLELEPLRSMEWLPARGDTRRWHQAGSLYAPYRAYLFESQGGILDIRSPDGDLLAFLGVHIDPPPELVVRHLLHCAEHGVPVNTEVYRFLNDEADDPVIERLRYRKCLWLGQAYRSPDHVFWGDHRFGRYRWRLADELRGYGDLLEKIGVTDTPDHEDALSVLNEISAEFGNANSPLDDEAYDVLMGCWQMIEEALEAGALTAESLHSLSGMKGIPNKARVLYFPAWLFFENRAGLAAKFGTFLTSNVIPRPLKTGRAFLAAGVRQLGSAVELDLLRNDDPVDDPDTGERLGQRDREIARVLSGQMPARDVVEALERLGRLEFMSATSLVIQYRFDEFDRVVQSEQEPVPALYQPGFHRLWTTHANGQTPWASLARELSIALCPEHDPGLFAAGLKEVLAAETAAEAASVLDELGFSQLDTTVVEPPSSQEAAEHLGVPAPLEDEGLPWHGGQDGSRPGLGPTEQDGYPTAEGALRALGIAHDPTPPVREPAEPAAPFRTGGGPGPGTQAGGGRGEPSSHRGQPPARYGTHPEHGRKFVSYVALRPEVEEESDADGLTQQERIDLENQAIDLIQELEPGLARTPTNNPGFDLTEPGPDARPVRWIEVKAMKGTLKGRPVGLSRTQFESAREHGPAFWLYVVERAGIPDQARIVRIQDPAGRAGTFTFDHGWVAVAEGAGTTDPRHHR